MSGVAGRFGVLGEDPHPGPLPHASGVDGVNAVLVARRRGGGGACRAWFWGDVFLRGGDVGGELGIGFRI